ncbi:hypothetical protein, partial [Ferruginibacter sp.]
MKTLIYITTILFFGCTQRQTNDKNISTIDTSKKLRETKIELPQTKVARAKYHTDKDTVYNYKKLSKMAFEIAYEHNTILMNILFALMPAFLFFLV